MRVFLAPRCDGRSAVACVLNKLANALRSVPFVEAHMLMLPRRGLRTLDRNAIEGGFEKLHVVRVCTAHRHAQRDVMSVDRLAPSLL